MPNCFQLIRKSDPEAGPVPLVKIDEEMCQHFGVPCHPALWHHDWYDTIGFGLTTGQSFAEQRAEAEAAESTEDRDQMVWLTHQIEVIDWLDANFTPSAWAEIGRR